MDIHASGGREYGYAQQTAEADGPGQGHPAGETLELAKLQQIGIKYMSNRMRA